MTPIDFPSSRDSGVLFTLTGLDVASVTDGISALRPLPSTSFDLDKRVMDGDYVPVFASVGFFGTAFV